MKRFELILLLLGFVTVAFAYAGFADRFANVFVSMNTAQWKNTGEVF